MLLARIICRDVAETIAFQKDYIARLTAQLRDAREKAGLATSSADDLAGNSTASDVPPSLQDIGTLQPLFQAYDVRISVSLSKSAGAQPLPLSAASRRHCYRSCQLLCAPHVCRSWNACEEI